MPKTTVFSLTPSATVSVPAAMRCSSVSARAGMIASRSGPACSSSRLLEREPVRVGGGHEQPRALEPHLDPRQHRPRLVLRRRARNAVDRLEQRGRRDRVRRRGRSTGAAGSPRPRRRSASTRSSRSRSARRLPRAGTRSSPRPRAAVARGRRGASRGRRPRCRLRPSPAASCAARAPCRWRRARGPSAHRVEEDARRAPARCRATRRRAKRSPSFATSSSRSQVTVRPDPTAMSVSIMILNPLVVVRRECG